jgi:hypothetical protein
MRNAVVGIVIGSVLAVACLNTELQQGHLFGQFSSAVGSETGPSSVELIALSSDAANGPQQVAVIDPKSRVMSVYHIDHSTGMISLKSVRNIHADLLMDEFNTGNPLPREIRAILKQRQ